MAKVHFFPELWELFRVINERILENMVSIETGGGLDQRGFLEEIPCSSVFLDGARKSLSSLLDGRAGCIWRIWYYYPLFHDSKYKHSQLIVFTYIKKYFFHCISAGSICSHYLHSKNSREIPAHTHKIALRWS